MSGCKFRDVFGRPREGIHAYRFLGVAIVDVVGTVVVALLMSYLFRWSIGWTVLGAFLAAILMHRAFCVNTAVNVALFGRLP